MWMLNVTSFLIEDNGIEARFNIFPSKDKFSSILVMVWFTLIFEFKYLRVIG